MSVPRPFSVIISSHNPGTRLDAALESIWIQRVEPPELIVVDHGSHDGTAAKLEAQRSRLSGFISGAGLNRSDALNAAIGRATGEWVLLLDGRDRLVGDTILSETLNWMKKTEAGVVSGVSAFDDGRLQKLRSHVNAAARNFTPRSATFYRRTVFAENGGFDPALEVMAEYEFNVRLWKSRVRFKPIPLRIAACGAAGARFDWRGCREEIRVRHRYFSAGRCWWWDFASLLRCAGHRMAPGRR